MTGQDCLELDWTIFGSARNAWLRMALLLSISRGPTFEANEHSQAQTKNYAQSNRHKRNRERRKVHKRPKAKLLCNLLHTRRVGTSPKPKQFFVLRCVMPQSFESQGDSDERT
jgi:hypothetical protein